MTRHRPRNDPPCEPEPELPPVVAEHTHDMPPSSWQRALTIGFLLVVLGLAIFAWNAWNTQQRLGNLEDYVSQAKTKRDAQNQQLHDAIDRAACDFLDRLPAGPLWDPMREDYGCGPGIPPDEYTAAATAVTPEQFYNAFAQTRTHD